MNKNTLGILGLFILIFGFTWVSNENFINGYNMTNLVKWSSLYAIMGIGVAFVIITGGIDLSIGSVIGLIASLLALAVKNQWNPTLTVVLLLGLSLVIGLMHGLLITKVKLQPFVVTLCGLLFYRGISRWLTDNQTMQYPGTEGLDSFFSGKVYSFFSGKMLLVDLLAPLGVGMMVVGCIGVFVTFVILLIANFRKSIGWGIASLLLDIPLLVFCILNYREVKKPFLLHLWSGALVLLGFIFAAVGTTGEKFGLASPFFFLLVVAVVAAFFLNRTIWGRYLLALGNNEEGARYSGIQTDRLKITAYVICSFLAGLSGLLFAYELDSVQPAQTGEFYELYAIAAAVLGGCSLRGGQGAILGVIIAAAVIRLLRNSINLVGVSTHLEFAIIGLVILGGVTADEIIKRIVAKRRTAQVKAAKG
ncbi:MAG: ABC transporter permease [Verrucomicrobiota bacterium]|jgi:ribose transport system permease protein|nr:ABC transporter permease [Verrucomicrobiota bacterium]MDP7048257.1 ABC transporter permease [Verrucomicrobiota bacterium]